ncbi:MAG TPA: tetratricopeptide repeat protein [Myxococcota bacterium]|nr:tetratricopeptide repeat protein [Myxococcota bacterium]
MGQSAQLTPDERRDYELGKRYFERGDAETSLPHLTRLIQTRNFADVHYMIGVLYHRKGDLGAAGHSLREALRINPGYSEALLALANVYENQGDFDRSREIAERAGRLARSADGALDATTRGKLANLQAAVGDAYREVGELRDAIEAYRKALDRCPNFPDIRNRLGIALRDAGLPDRAIAEFRRILRVHPQFVDAAVQLGLTLYSIGRAEEAAQEWEAVLAEHPDCDEARMYLRMIGRY